MSLESFAVEAAGGRATLQYADLTATSGGPNPGPPVVFVHGLGGASTLEYAQVAAQPGLAGRRRLLVDLIGSGRSDRPRDFDHTVEGQARCLDSFLTALGLTRVVLYGHSMGGAISLSLAALDAGRVASLVLSESNLDAGGGPESRAIAGQDADRFARVGWPGLLDAVRASGVPWIRTLPLSSPAAVQAEAVSLVAGVVPSWRQILYGLGCPRFHLFGSHTLPDPDFEELPRHGVATIMVPDCGHNMAWENPAGVADGIVPCLEATLEG
ncbi:MAG: alpha/beta hydrolase [Propionibacteriaceae bacterium]|jgi:pimeloyl-ACP methyl ester carboxylesterase|nr:alpha/beta hydrolase [Propionibacteriaceae bacterium]